MPIPMGRASTDLFLRFLSLMVVAEAEQRLLLQKVSGLLFPVHTGNRVVLGWPQRYSNVDEIATRECLLKSP